MHGEQTGVSESGRFITLEGGEGAGKSTQARRLGGFLERAGLDIVRTREPGGCAQAESIRSLLVTGEAERWSANGEALLNYAARDCHIANVIAPALSRGQWVLSDRFHDSTRAYQGLVGGADMVLIDHLEQAIVADFYPDLTLILDLDAAEGLRRAVKRDLGDDEQRFERKGLAFHEHLREAFHLIAQSAPERCVVIDASQPVDTVTKALWQAVTARFALSLHP